MKAAKNFLFFRSVLLTSLLTFLIAELIFGGFYYLVIQLSGLVYSGVGLLSNSQIETNFGLLSPLNAGIFLIFLCIISFITFLEISTIIAITTYDWFRDDHIPLKTLLSFVFGRVRKLFTRKNIPLFVLMTFFPKEHISKSSVFTLEIPEFVTNAVLQNTIQTTIFLITLGVGTYILYRSIFVVHEMFFYDIGFFISLKKSFKLTKKIGVIKMAKMFVVSTFFGLIFLLPVLAGLFVLGKIFVSMEILLGSTMLLFASMTLWLQNFFWISIPGVMFLASLTDLYIKNADISEKKFYKTFYFLQKNPEEIPRWKNLRKIFTKKRTVLFVVIFSIFSVVLSLFFVKIEVFSLQKIEVISHRGYLIGQEKNYMENTLEAIENAYKKGASKVEIDVYENASGNLFLLHDIDLKRVAKRKDKIFELTDLEIQNITLLDGSKIPSLEEVFKLAKAKNIHLIVEPKIHGKEKFLYKKLVELVKKYEMHGLVSMHSLSLETVLTIKKLDPKIPVGYTIFGGMGNFSTLEVDFFSLQQDLISQALVDEIHAANKKVYIWTVNSTEKLEKYLQLGVDGFITDEVEGLQIGIKEIRKKEQKNPSLVLQIFGKRIVIGYGL